MTDERTRIRDMYFPGGRVPSPRLDQIADAIRGLADASQSVTLYVDDETYMSVIGDDGAHVLCSVTLGDHRVPRTLATLRNASPPPWRPSVDEAIRATSAFALRVELEPTQTWDVVTAEPDPAPPRSTSRPSWGLLLLVAAAVLIVGFAWITRWVDRRVKDAHSGPVYAYQVQPAPQFLADAVALDKARQSLARDGYDLAAWRASERPGTRAPDGTPDAYLDRDRPDAGTITFWDKTGRDPNPRRYVIVELKEGRVEASW